MKLHFFVCFVKLATYYGLALSDLCFNLLSIHKFGRIDRVLTVFKELCILSGTGVFFHDLESSVCAFRQVTGEFLFVKY